VTGTRSLLLWVGLIAAPLAWFAQLAIGYEAVDGGCSPAGGAGDVFGIGAESAALVVTIPALVFAAVGVLAALATWRSGADVAGYVRFLGFAALVGSVVLLATILLAGAGVLALSPCGQS
jgi:hypothetical protein